MWIDVVLLNDRVNNNGNSKINFALLCAGFTLVIIGCFSMMSNFFPTIVSTNITSSTTMTHNNDDVARSELQEYLLPTENIDQNRAINISNNLVTAVENNDEETEIVIPDYDESTYYFNEINSDQTTSRFDGTRRLLAVAKPQLSYLYIGCVTLLIRMPFSLSIPHFVSTTLGALSNAEYNHCV
jgi:hypothetical protein